MSVTGGMNPEVLYADRLVELAHDFILLRDYYFPCGDKRVSFSEIDQPVLKKPTIWTGKYRFHGNGDFQTRFASDLSRN